MNNFGGWPPTSPKTRACPKALFKSSQNIPYQRGAHSAPQSTCEDLKQTSWGPLTDRTIPIKPDTAAADVEGGSSQLSTTGARGSPCGGCLGGAGIGVSSRI
uniref:Uncharacterized protein n=1 Tax=Eutreptiella gymnastica TaxID=73025 RepID=A0A7S1HXL6_9EUGL|mmetsp:Transcript_112588/g.195552  ORF Transcript_112588/g.195552 Transcript_112588/m.195552 type:complete len:102 (+) Transcript_112588:674-979(+)